MNLVPFTRSATCLALLGSLSQAWTQEAHTRALGALSTGGVLARARDLPPDAGFAFPLFDEPGDGALWALGENFKARFDRRGLEFIPFLGSDALQNYPLDFSIASARIGERELAWDPDVQPERDGSTVRYHRGAFDEVFEVGCDSIEHSFVFTERVSGGELDIRVRVDGELERASDALGASFSNERGGVRYGRATLVDARGTRLVSATHLVDNSIEIRTPQVELERAHFPLTVDPIISSFQVNDASSTHLTLDADVSYDLDSDTFLSVFEDVYSQSDHDVVARQFNGQGVVLPGGTTFIDFTGNTWTRPRVANNNAQNQFMVVAEVNSPTLIQARTRSATSTAMGNQFFVALGGGTAALTFPDIGGDSYPLGSPAYCLVWGASAYSTGLSCINYALISPYGTTVQSGCVSDGDDARMPSISKSNGTPSYGDSRWSVIWNSLHVGVRWNQISLSGGVVSCRFNHIQPTDQNERPAVSPILDEYGPDRRFVVGMLFPDTRHVYGYMVSSSAESPSGLYLDGFLSTSISEHAPRIEYDGSRLIVAFHCDTSPANQDVLITSLAYFQDVGGYWFLENQWLGTTPGSESRASICSKHSSGSSSPDCMTVWDRPDFWLVKHGTSYVITGGVFGAVHYEP